MKPMLAAKAPDDSSNLIFPLFASPKIDGIRAVISNGQVLSRTLKPIPNEYIQSVLGNTMFNGLDGELTVGKANDYNVMQKTTSGVMSREGEPSFIFWVFDNFNAPNIPYYKRLSKLDDDFNKPSDPPYYNNPNNPRIKILEQSIINNEEELKDYELSALCAGYEGVMIRSMHGPYKYGRSTVNEGFLLKLKRFSDSEAIVIGADELLHNDNNMTIDALGYSKRSSHKDGMIPRGVLGALKVKDIISGVEFHLGTGYNAAQRAVIWSMWLAGELSGKIVKYSYFRGGIKEAPRFPVFLGFRDPIDVVVDVTERWVIREIDS